MTSSPDPEIPATDAGTVTLDPEIPAAAPAPEVVAELPLHVATEASAPERGGRRLAMRFAVSFLVGVALVVGIGAGALYAWSKQYDGRILPGVHIGATDLSGLTPDEARAAIAGAYASLGGGTIVLAGPAGDVTIAESAISRGPDVDAILGAALAAGRQGAPFADLIGAPQAALRGVAVPEAVTYDHAKLAAAVDALATSIDRPAVDGSISKARNGSFVAVASQDGVAVDRIALLATLEAQLGSLDAPARIAARVPVVAVAPALTTDAVNQAKATADRIAVDLVFTQGTERWTIAGSKVRSLITFAPSGGAIRPVVDESGLDPLIKVLARQVNRTATNARFRLSGGHVVVSAASRDGRTMNLAATKVAVVGVLLARQASQAALALAPVVKTVKPAISSTLANGSVAKMRPISSWKTWFPIGSHNNNGANIWTPARLINGTVVAPGATFDFWKVVGTPTAAQGFGWGAAIVNGHTNPTGAWAGGICSNSTTLFNAALRAGMKMQARQNHFYYINRYPLGLDATVWMSGGAKQTMSWTNDTPYPVLIQGEKIRQGSIGWVKYTLWSVPNGRTIKIGQPVVKNYERAPDTTVHSSSIRRGYSYRAEFAVDGEQVWRTVRVYDHGKLIRTTTYFSNYATVTGVYVIGTGGPGAGLPPPT